MLGLLAVIVANVGLHYWINRQIPSVIRSILLQYAALLYLVGAGLSIAYTLENEWIFAQDDIPGDAQYYIGGAQFVLSGAGAPTSYPAYDWFLSTSLFLGSPLIARFSHFGILGMIFILAAVLVWRLSGKDQNVRYFCRFFVLNGIFYGLATQLVRDVVILLAVTMTLFGVVLALGRPKFSVIDSLWASVGAVILVAVSGWQVFVLGAAVSIEMAYRAVVLKAGMYQRFAAITAFGVLLGLGALYSDQIEFLYDVNVEQDLARKSNAEAYGSSSTRSLADPLKAIFGPGLIRPLRPSVYFMESTNLHAAMYWWGTACWYLNLLITLPSLLFALPKFQHRKGAIALVVTLLGFFFIYTYAHGSGMGMRKRALFQLLYLLVVSSVVYMPPNKWAAQDAFRRHPVTTAVIIVALAAAMVGGTYLSIDTTL